jgi:hypothetical protein
MNELADEIVNQVAFVLIPVNQQAPFDSHLKHVSFSGGDMNGN